MGSRGVIDLTGQQFGRLTVTGFAGMQKKWAAWNCACECGNTKIVRSGNLRTGQIRSCGCLSRELASARNAANIEHGACDTDEYRAWRGMKNRCLNPNEPKYHLYGGRGIRICDRWLNDFPAFLADVGPRPTARHSIDRYPNKDGNYEPGNVRWATYSEQNSNRRTYTRRRSIKNAAADLTDQQVAQIRARRAAGEKLAAIAADYAVTYQAVSKIARGERRSIARNGEH